MIEAVRNVHALGIPFEDAIAAATTVPARILGRTDVGVLEPGGPADVVVLDDRLEIVDVLCAGGDRVVARDRAARAAGCARAAARAAGRTCAELAAPFRRDDVRYVLIASRGSSSNAARYAQYVLGRANRVPVMFATPSLYTIYEQPPRLDGAVVVGISQSGASPDVRAVLAEARRQGRPTIALTNDAASPLAREADVVALARGGRGARGRCDEDVPQLARRDRAPLRGDRRRRASRRAELERMPVALEQQIALSFDERAAARRVRGRRRRDGRRARRQLRHRRTRSRSRSASCRGSSSRRTRRPISCTARSLRSSPAGR